MSITKETTFQEIAATFAETAIFPRVAKVPTQQDRDFVDDAFGVTYCQLGALGELGELANTLKKLWRDDGGVLTDARSHKLFKEFGDVVWYSVMLCREHLAANPEDSRWADAKLSTIEDIETIAGRSCADYSPGNIANALRLVVAQVATSTHLAPASRREQQHLAGRFDPELLLIRVECLARHLNALWSGTPTGSVFSLHGAAVFVIEKLQARARAGTIKGAGDDR